MNASHTGTTGSQAQAQAPAADIDLDTFRLDVRRFLADAVPEDIRASVRARCLVTRDQAMRWQRVLFARGWAAPGWPREHGGPGWSLAQQAVFREELAASDAPRYENLGIDTIGPTIIRNGTPQQCARYLPGILSFDDFWAQAYSEPQAGSDLASLQTTARRDADHYVLNGTKIWQSYGHWANQALVLARTDPSAGRKQNGISVLLVDLTSPGVTIRPIRYMHGGVLHVQIFFDEVRVPADQLLGAENEGWKIAKGLLVTERLFVARVAECKAELETTRRLAEGRGLHGQSLLARDVYARRLAEQALHVRALDAGWWPAVQAVEAGLEPALDASLLKLLGNEVLQALHQLQLDLIGTDALVFDPLATEGTPGDPPLVPGHVGNLTMHVWRYRGITLGGGTSEVQRGIIAKAIFGGRTALDLTDCADLTEQQTMLDSGLRRLLAQRNDFERRRQTLQALQALQASQTSQLSPTPTGTDDALWRALGELGLSALLVPDDDGGFGGTLADLVPVMMALGESLVLEPYLWASALPTRLVLDVPTHDERSRALDALMGGQQMAFAHADRGAATAAFRDTAGWRLNGDKTLVMGGDTANSLLVSARLEDGGCALFSCTADLPGITLRRYRLHDGRGAADIVFDDVHLPATARIAGPDRAVTVIDEALMFATVALCAESVGLMRRALALTVEYMRTRRQFGSALCDHQALQHRVVEHYRLWVQARALVMQAAHGWDTSSPVERARRVSAAKWMTGRAGRSVALDVLQLHGAIGLQDETEISHHARRLIANDALLGDTTAHMERYIALSGDVT